VLTSDLVQVKRSRGAITPRYIDPAKPERIELAQSLIATFEEHVGRSRRELEEALKEQLGTGTAFQLHRGLVKLLYDRCELETRATVEPEALRRAAFTAAAAALRHPEAGEIEVAAPLFDRSAALRAGCAAVGLPEGEFEGTLYADLKEEQVLEALKPTRAPWLLERYNTALAQGLLLRAREMEIHLTGGEPRAYRALFRKIKFFQLMHRIEALPGGEGYRIRLDGPLSLFQASQKYGLQMALFLPTLLHFEGWTLEAKLLWGKTRRASTFQLSAAEGLRSHTRLTGQWQPEELTWLPGQLQELDPDWQVSTDGEVIDLGGRGVLVPDFVFHHQPTDTRVVMEVFGFWNRGAVESRLKLLRRHGPANLILALSKSLAGGETSELEGLPGEVYIFRVQPLARQVLKQLGRFLG
jgi:uncharacterized protein